MTCQIIFLGHPQGKNDGSVGGKHYFHCNPGYGVLVKPDRVSRGGAKRRRQHQQQKRRSANLSDSTPNLAALTALAKGEGGSTGRSKGENRKSWNSWGVTSLLNWCLLVTRWSVTRQAGWWRVLHHSPVRWFTSHRTASERCRKISRSLSRKNISLNEFQ